MMTKKIKGRDYLYLYKTKWVNGKPKSKFVRYLGPKDSVDDEHIQKYIREEEKKVEK
ncbi:hypothetical protein ACFLRC_02530 [Candidatus Altiarchaeota archaeon]